MSRKFSSIAVLAIVAAFLSLGASSAMARKASLGGKPNVLVIMTDDQALTDLSQMPNVQNLLVSQGTRFNNTIDSFPLCCPSRATFLTGQYAHNHGVGANFWPYGWYGMKDRGNTLGTWMQNAGYTTGAIGKWLNGYGTGKGAQTGVDIKGKTQKINVAKGGEVAAGFDIWRALLDTSAYDYFNYAMSVYGGKFNGVPVTSRTVKYFGDSDFAKQLVEFGNLQIKPNAGLKPATVVLTAQSLLDFSAVARKHNNGKANTWYGSAKQADYSPDVTGNITSDLIKDQASAAKPFFFWWTPASPHREDNNSSVRNPDTKNPELNAHHMIDPRPPLRYNSPSKLGAGFVDYAEAIMTKPNFNYSDPTERDPTDVNPIRKPSNLLELPAHSQTYKVGGVTKWTSSQAKLESNYRSRIGALRAVDDKVKTIVDQLSSTGQLNNTVIVLTSDNGWMQGEHRIPGDKFLPYEESVKVPFVIRGPGIQKNVAIDQMVSNVDFAPTILAAAGGTSGRTLDGTSLLGLAKGTSTIPNRAIGLEATAPLFSTEGFPNQWDQQYQGVRTSEWKYIEWKKSGMKQLWNLKEDPYELSNIAVQGTPVAGSVQAQMKLKMLALQTCTGSACRAVSPVVTVP